MEARRAQAPGSREGLSGGGAGRAPRQGLRPRRPAEPRPARRSASPRGFPYGGGGGHGGDGPVRSGCLASQAEAGVRLPGGVSGLPAPDRALVTRQNASNGAARRAGRCRAGGHRKSLERATHTCVRKSRGLWSRPRGFY